jgi:hypothetical protein
MNQLRSRPATAADLARFYPGLSASVRAWVCELDGSVEGIIGLALLRPAHSVFSVFSDRLRPFLRSLTIMRLIRRLKVLIETCQGPVLAVRERRERQSVHILKRIGFRFLALHEGDAIYQYEGGV